MSEVMSEPDVPVLETEAEVPLTVGEQLRQAREAKSMSVADVAQAMKLGTRQVEALESGHWNGLPGTTFVRGFIRNYARLVQIDPQPLMLALDDLLVKSAPKLALPEAVPAMMSAGGKAERRDYLFVIGGVAFVLIAVGAYFLLPNDLSSWRETLQGGITSLSRPASEPVAATPAAPETVLPPGATVQEVISPQAVVVSGAPATESPAVVTAEPVSVATPAQTPDSKDVQKPTVEADKAASTSKNAPLLLVFSKESWVEVRDRNGNVLLSQRVPAGAERQVDGLAPFSLVLGNAPGVAVKFKGKDVDLKPSTSGDVARLKLE